VIRKLAVLALIGTLSVGMQACEKKGPVERAGEEVDEAVDTMKHGGKESMSSKADDAMDDARKDAKDLADKAKDESK
jgi:predicted small lipoprotein YifL